MLPAVDEQRMSFPAEHRHKLIHNATGYTSMSVFCLLAGYCFGYFVSIVCGNRQMCKMVTKDQSS